MVSVRVGRGGTTRSWRGQARFRQSRVRFRPQLSGPVVLCRRRCPYEGAAGEDEVRTYASYGGTYAYDDDSDDSDDDLAMPLGQPHLQSSVPWMTGAPGAAVSSSSSSKR